MGAKGGNVFQRVEKKYQLNAEQYRAFMRGCEGRIQLDEFGLHTISNIYYDTEHYDLIRTSLEKPKYKEKFRLRGYGEVTPESTVYLEIKKKYKGIVYKRRTSMTLQEMKECEIQHKMPKEEDQIMKEIAYFFQHYHPIPKLYLAYDRMAYTGVEDSQLRLTIDQNIRSRRDHLDLEWGDEGKVIKGGENLYLMEIKVPAAYPIWLASLLAELEIYPKSFSKYGTVYQQDLIHENDVQQMSETQEIWNKETQEEEGEETCLQAYSVG